MKTKVAVFARQELIDRLHTYIKGQDDIEITPFVFTEAKETGELIEKAFMCDVYLFTESLSYLYAKEKINKRRLPAVQIAYDEYMILTSFYRLKYQHHQELNRISIDVFNQQYAEEVITELNLTERDIYLYEFGKDRIADIDKMIEFHCSLWEKGKIDFVLTSVHEVEHELKLLGIPANYMEIPKINILQGLEKVKSIAKLNQSKSAQIVAGYVRIKNLEKIRAEKGEFITRELLVNLYKILLKFSHKTYASVLTNNNNQYVLFGTRGVLDHITNHYRDFPLLKEIESSLKAEVDIGFGLGLTAKQAEDHAKLALEACMGSRNSSCYIVNDRQDTIGPLGVKKQFDTSRLYQALIHKARLNNELSYNFIDFITLRNNEPFSSHDVATFYRVTKRSAERTVNKLLTGEVIKVVGEEKPYVKGRPRKLFQINV